MTVRCPRCGTLYRRPARFRHESDATFRCARCRHVFVPGENEAGLGEPAVEDDDRFSFAEEDTDDEPAVEIAPSPPPPPRPESPRRRRSRVRTSRA
jgi:hypothetical protein